MRHGQIALKLATEHDMPLLAVRIAANLGLALMWREQYDAAWDHYALTVPLAQQAGAARTEAVALTNQALAGALGQATSGPQRREAIRCGLRSVELFRTLSDDYGRAVTRNNLGVVYTSVLQLREAFACHTAAVDGLRAFKDQRELVARDDAGYRLQAGTFMRLWDAGGLPEFLSF
jgi:hypothetical protein